MTGYKFETTTIVDEEKAHQRYTPMQKKMCALVGRLVSVELILEQTMSA